MRDWKSVWSNRSGDANSLEDLLKLNGFDSGAGLISATSWLNYVSSVVEEFDINPGESILELGCGAGAFLKALQDTVGRLDISGVDYSPALLGIAQKVIPDGDFTRADLRNFQIEKDYDVIVAHSVFQYLSRDVAERISRNALRNARRLFAVLDVPRLETKNESEAARKAGLGARQYEKKYRGLGHSYFDAAFFESIPDLNWTISVSDCRISGYGNSEYRASYVYRRTSKLRE